MVRLSGSRTICSSCLLSIDLRVNGVLLQWVFSMFVPSLSW